MTYTELIGVVAGVALILVACLGYKLFNKKPLQSFDGWALSFGGLGFILTLLGTHMLFATPLAPQEESFKNILFGGFALPFGVLLLMASFYLWRRGNELAEMMKAGRDKAEAALTQILSVARPVSWFVFAIGIALAGVAVGAFQRDIFGSAPTQEPILGTGPSGLINFYIASVLYVLPAIGALLTPLAVYTRNRTASSLVWLAWLLGGIGLLALGAFVFYAHIIMEFNFRAGV